MTPTTRTRAITIRGISGVNQAVDPLALSPQDTFDQSGLVQRSFATLQRMEGKAPFSKSADSIFGIHQLYPSVGGGRARLTQRRGGVDHDPEDDAEDGSYKPEDPPSGSTLECRKLTRAEVVRLYAISPIDVAADPDLWKILHNKAPRAGELKNAQNSIANWRKTIAFPFNPNLTKCLRYITVDIDWTPCDGDDLDTHIAYHPFPTNTPWIPEADPEWTAGFNTVAGVNTSVDIFGRHWGSFVADNTTGNESHIIDLLPYLTGFGSTHQSMALGANFFGGTIQHRISVRFKVYRGGTPIILNGRWSVTGGKLMANWLFRYGIFSQSIIAPGANFGDYILTVHIRGDLPKRTIVISRNP